MALPLRLGLGRVSPPQGPCLQDQCQQSILVTCSFSRGGSRPPRASLRLPGGPGSGGSMALACQVLSRCRACAKLPQVKLGHNPCRGRGCGGWYYHSHSPEEEIPNSLVPSCHLWPRSAVCEVQVCGCARDTAVFLERGPGPWWICPGPAGSEWVTDLVQETFHSVRPGDCEGMFMRAGDVTQERAST